MLFVQQNPTGLPQIGDDKRVILYGVGAILTAMTSAFALLWRAYQSQVEARQADYKDVITVLRAVESQGNRIIEKLQALSDKIDAIVNINRRQTR